MLCRTAIDRVVQHHCNHRKPPPRHRRRQWQHPPGPAVRPLVLLLLRGELAQRGVLLLPLVTVVVLVDLRVQTVQYCKSRSSFRWWWWVRGGRKSTVRAQQHVGVVLLVSYQQLP